MKNKTKQIICLPVNLYNNADIPKYINLNKKISKFLKHKKSDISSLILHVINILS